MTRRRVWVTGLGLVSPHGDDVGEVFRRVCAGEPAVRRVHFDREGREADLLLARPDWSADAHFTPVQKLTLDPTAQMGLAAARAAVAHAGLDGRADLLREAGIYFGAGYGAQSFDETNVAFHDRKTRRVKPTTIPRVMPNATAGQVSMDLGVMGPACTHSNACVSSSMAIGEAFRAIRDGYVDCVLAGGAQASLSEPVLCGWGAMAVLADEHPDGPGASLRPFDQARTGFVLGEGAAVLVLESEEQARARGAVPLAELVGYGASSDAFNLTQPSEDGQARAMAATLADAGVPASAVGYVNAHATGTKVGDVVEIRALKKAFGAHAGRLAISATKSMHGHLIEAGGALELLLTVMTLKEGVLPPTANLTDPDPECDLDLVPVTGRPAPDLEYALSNSFGFGGSNVGLLVRKASV